MISNFEFSISELFKTYVLANLRMNKDHMIYPNTFPE